MTSQTQDGNVYQFGAKAAPPRDPFKDMVIDAICGAGFTTANQAVRYERMRLARMASPDGSTPSEKWFWQRAQLTHMEVSALTDLYEELKQIQWAQERELSARTLVSMLEPAGPVSEIPA